MFNEDFSEVAMEVTSTFFHEEYLMGIELNLAILSEGSIYALIVDSTTVDEARKELDNYGYGAAVIVDVCPVVMNDGDYHSSKLASTYEALMGLNALSDDHPEVADLLTFLFTKGFEAGVKHQQEQQRRAVEIAKTADRAVLDQM